MRVLHVVSSNQRRGAEVFALDLMRQLTAVGVQQRVAVLRSRAEGLEYPVTTIDLKANGRGSAVRSMMRLDYAVKSWRPDIVQAHGGDALNLLAPTLLRSSRPPVVHRRIGLTPDWMAGRIRKRAHGLPMRRSAAVVAVADAVARQVVEEFGVPRSLVVTIANAVDERRTRSARGRNEVRAELAVPADAAVALFVGALNDEKNPLDLIEIADRVTRAVQNAYFVVAGEGPLGDDLRRAATKLGLEERFRLLGSRSSVADLLLACDSLVMTSRSEGLPAAAIEAGLTGRAVVAYAVGGVPEVVVDEVTGVTTDPGDPARLAEGLAGLLADPGRRNRLGARGRMRCRELFEIKKVAARYMDLYESVVGQGRHNSVTAQNNRLATMKESLDEA